MIGSNRIRHNERGLAVSLEAAILLPGLILFLALIVVCARIALAQQAVEAIAAQSAREASLQRSISRAIPVVNSATKRGFIEHHLPCISSRTSHNLSGLNRPIGTPAKTAVTINCTLSLADTAFPGIPGTITIHSTQTSPIDPYRGR